MGFAITEGLVASRRRVLSCQIRRVKMSTGRLLSAAQASIVPHRVRSTRVARNAHRVFRARGLSECQETRDDQGGQPGRFLHGCSRPRSTRLRPIFCHSREMNNRAKYVQIKTSSPLAGVQHRRHRCSRLSRLITAGRDCGDWHCWKCGWR
jgi:hypothetical protein